MTAAVDEPAEPLNESQPEGPGARLRAARHASGLDLERVAAQLHLKPAQVEDLEHNRYDGFAARVFVRGYLRNYARLVELSVDEVLKAFDAACPDPDRPRELRRVGTHKPQVGSGHGVVRMISWALLLGIVALFFVWWAGYLELNGSAPIANETVEDVQPEPAPGELVAPVGGLAPLPSPATSEPETPPEAASAVPVEEPVSGDAAQPLGAEAPVFEAPTTDEPAPAVAPEVAPEPPEPVATGPQVVLSLSGPCWVEIRDASGDYRLIGNFGAGTREVLGGSPPYRILLGNAKVAELTVDGQAVDLAPHTRAQVARFTLDPNAP